MAGVQCLQERKKTRGVSAMEGELTKTLPLIGSALLSLSSASPKLLPTFFPITPTLMQRASGLLWDDL